MRRDALAFAVASLHDAASDLHCAGEDEIATSVGSLAKLVEMKLKRAETEHEELSVCA